MKWAKWVRPSTLAVVLRLLACGLTLVLLSACGATDDQPTTAGSPAAPSPTADDSDNSPNPCLGSAGGNTPDDPRSDEQMTEQYLGLTEQEAGALAKDEGHTIRVAGRDGECFAMTMDYREDRVNIYLEDDTVTAATRG